MSCHWDKQHTHTHFYCEKPNRKPRTAQLDSGPSLSIPASSAAFSRNTGPCTLTPHRHKSRDNGRRPSARQHLHLPADPAQRGARVLQGGRDPVRPDPDHQTADGLQVQDRGGAEAWKRRGHQHEHRRHRLPAGAAVQGRGVGGLSRAVRHRGRPAHQERRPATRPSQHGV